jgi:cytochrome P450/glutathione S-transferase
VPVVTSYHPRLISVSGNPQAEVARWVLARLGIPYQEEARAGGSQSSAALMLDTTDALLTDGQQVIRYYEGRCADSRRLFPADPSARAETQQLVNFFFAQLGKAGPNLAAGSPAILNSVFDQVEMKLADGRRFLVGDNFTAADLSLAALAAAALQLAVGNGQSAVGSKEKSEEVEKLRARPAGQFIRRLYKQERQQPAVDLTSIGEHKSGQTFKEKVVAFLTGATAMRPFFKFVRWCCPNLALGKTAIISRHVDVIDVLTRDTEFTISQINAPLFDAIKSPFVLGMDRGAQHSRELAVLQQAVHREDIGRIRDTVRQSAAQLIQAAWPYGKIDSVNGIARVVPVRLLESYFGIPSPDDPTMMRWMRDTFHVLFVNLANDPLVKRDGVRSASELRQHVLGLIAKRREQRAEPNQPDDVLGRLVAMQGAANPWLDDDSVRREVGGLIVGAVDTTSKFVNLALDELFRRPAAFASARDAAIAGDMEAVRRHAYEAVRFNPHNTFVVRFCPNGAMVAAETKRERSIPAGANVIVGTLSAMFDPEKFPAPDEFRGDRDVEYLHFGFGLHRCFGYAINGVVIPEILAALLRLPNLRRAAGAAGAIVFDGPFPERFILEFDGGSPGGGAVG